jgi:hypothetical protein
MAALLDYLTVISLSYLLSGTFLAPVYVVSMVSHAPLPPKVAASAVGWGAVALVAAA